MATPFAVATLLIVDDDEAMLRLVHQSIVTGIQDELLIETFTDSVKAMARINEGGVDILITDLRLPEVDGIDLLLAAKRRRAHVQVLLMTAASSMSKLFAALESGAVDYVIKPFDPRSMVARVREAIERQRRWRTALAETCRQLRAPALTGNP